jgi:ring-1,2-phenylacetyl-CoA epoxidase subunit PaaD
MSKLRAETIWKKLQEVKDPEIPVLSVVELGIVRDVSVAENKVTVSLTPTYTGCPAFEVMQSEIRDALLETGAAGVDVRTVIAPPWTTEWISEEGRRKLKAFGIAPPPLRRERDSGSLHPLETGTPCPRCGSERTELKNRFGSTRCKAFLVCRSCGEPFEQIKML